MSVLPTGVRMLAAYAVAACAALLAGCAAGPGREAAFPSSLLADRHFGQPAKPIAADRIFQVSDAMRDYLSKHLQHGQADLQTALAESLYRDGDLKLEYESSITRNAAEAFDARAGNCLSLVVMTAAFAKELGLRVRYQSAFLQEDWSFTGNLLVRSGHVNITLGRRMSEVNRTPFGHDMTIDFLPKAELLGLKTREIPESLVVSMFMNNRGMEAIVAGQFDDAYAWVRGALLASPDFAAAQNTLGLLYMRRGLLAEAAGVFEHMLAVDGTHTFALANLSEVRRRQGLVTEAERLRRELAQIESRSPLHDYRLGLAAMREGDYRAARDFFEREVAQHGNSAAVRFWLGVALLRTGDYQQATEQVERALDMAPNGTERALYAAKLDLLRKAAK